MKITAFAGAALLALAATPLAAQNITAPEAAVPAGIKVERPMVPGPSLEGNLEGNATTREAMVVLPPSYGEDPDRRYPVVYYLHGFAIDGHNFYNFMNVPTAVADNAAAGREFIVVVPDTLTKMGGSMYSNSVTVGNFRDWVATDLVDYIDANYRTIATREGRGLAGHSMGGYGTWVIAMTHPEKFDSIWAQSACCVSPRSETVESAKAMAAVPYENVDNAGFGMRAGLASATAWAPNPNNPPYYVDFPITEEGEVDQLVIAKWANNSPLAMVASHLSALKSFDAIGSDVGTADGLIADDTMIHEELEKFGVDHIFETYEGDHVNKIGPRFNSVVLPFFAEHLDMGE
ncbi:enterochelin esterase-like enzyme [Altererythrobacter atlanticus]|uniref:Carbohydrate acetyl esterase/feruloyl esterase n=1 Tax=Croceibacterium atlanticum TaxID=1267766 RepID=A0A0F7KWC3_9SPHN|nr:alpha/beta fold hydrolase [Croceibacterium atlanticum]AKH43085.1 Carbohydrate acetyl esterase/feruloyl esterase precursor [Croceibacterium atlanticum]MBB5732211.1 enterochelin esterase-like enzyme [Croceibacterium atlanticum]